MRAIFLLITILFSAQVFGQTPCSSGFIANGVDDYITVPNTDAINLQNTRNRTIEFWFKTSDITSKQVIYEEGAQVNAFLFYLEGGRIYLGAFRNNASVTADRRMFRSGSGDIEVDTWYHVALTLEDTTSPDLTMKWYLNGVEQDSQDGLQVNTHSGDISFLRNGGELRFPSSLASNWVASSVGGSTSETYNAGFTGADGSDLNYAGNITLFRIWNVARTPSEIDTNKSTFLSSGTDLVAYLEEDRITYEANGKTTLSSSALRNGSQQYAVIPNTDAINLQNTRNRTIEFEFTAVDITTRQVLYEEGGGTNAITAFIEDGRFYFGAYRNNADSAANRRYFRSASGAIAINTTYHVALTLEDTASPDLTLKWYLNGVEQDSQEGLQVNTHSGDINVGRGDGAIRFPSSLTSNWTTSSVGGSSSETYINTTSTDSNTNDFTGSINLFRIWNVARTPSEIDTNKSTLLTSGTSLVTYQDGTVMNYEPNGGSSISASVNENGVFVWDGSSTRAWATTTNWVADSNPNATKAQHVVIGDGTNDPEITTEVLIGNLTVDAGAEIIVKSGGTLNVYYDIVNNGTITVEDGGALIYNSCTKTASGSGTYTIKRNSPSYTDKYFFSYWSSPLVEADSDPTVLFPNSPYVYAFNANQMSADWVFNGGANFKPGNGYAVRSESAGSYSASFTGTPNFRDISVMLYNNSNADASDTVSSGGDNLVGNPYASAIDWDRVITDPDNADLEGTIYVWDQNAAYAGNNSVDDYLEYNITGGASNTTTGKLGTGQGFFIRVSSAATLKFKTTHQIAANNTQFYRGGSGGILADDKKEGRSWLELSRANLRSPILIGFLKGATNEFDRLYDSPYNDKNTSFGFYSLNESGKKSAIQGLPKLVDYSKVISLGFVIDEVGEQTIRVTEEHINRDYDIYLEDTLLNTFTNLREGAYTFTIDTSGENNTRFKIHYTQSLHLNKDLLPEESEHHIYVDAIKDIEVLLRGSLSSASIKNVSVYDIQGRRVALLEQDINERRKLNVANLNSGLYIVNVTLYNSDRRLTKKIIVTN